jgi:hypothetical protein
MTPASSGGRSAASLSPAATASSSDGRTQNSVGPEPLSDLPSLIQQNQNNVEIFLQDGTYDTDLTV